MKSKVKKMNDAIYCPIYKCYRDQVKVGETVAIMKGRLIIAGKVVKQGNSFYARATRRFFYVLRDGEEVEIKKM